MAEVRNEDLNPSWLFLENRNWKPLNQVGPRKQREVGEKARHGQFHRKLMENGEAEDVDLN